MLVTAHWTSVKEIFSKSGHTLFGHLTKTEDKDAQSGGSVVWVTACHSLEASIGNWLLSNGMVEHRLKI